MCSSDRMAYSVQTATTPSNGAMPSAGPDQGGRSGPGGGRGPGGNARRFGPTGGVPAGGPTRPGGNTGGFPAGGPPGVGAAAGGANAGGPPGMGAAAGGANAGGLLSGSTSSDEITALLKQDAGSYRWTAAAIGSNSASGFQLASGKPVMPIGGFNGSDPSPTLTQFKAYVADGDIHWFIAGGRRTGGGMGGGPGGRGGSSSTSNEISTWVAANFTATTVDGVTLYDLTTG